MLLNSESSAIYAAASLVNRKAAHCRNAHLTADDLVLLSPSATGLSYDIGSTVDVSVFSIRRRTGHRVAWGMTALLREKSI